MHSTTHCPLTSLVYTETLMYGLTLDVAAANQPRKEKPEEFHSQLVATPEGIQNAQEHQVRII